MSTAYDINEINTTTSSRLQGETFTVKVSAMRETGIENFIERLSGSLGPGSNEQLASKIIQFMSGGTSGDAIAPAGDWNIYLRSLEDTRFPVQQVAHVRTVLSALAASAGGPLRPPQAGPGDDGALMMVWDVAGSHLEIEILADGRWEWFHSKGGAFDGGDVGAVATVPEPLRGLLVRFVAR